MKTSFFRRTQLFLSLVITFGSLIILLCVLSFTKGIPHFVDLALFLFAFGCVLALLTAVETLSILHVNHTGLSCTFLGIHHWNCRWDEIQVFEFGRGYFTKVIKISFLSNDKVQHKEIEITHKILNSLRNNTSREDLCSLIDTYIITHY